METCGETHSQTLNKEIVQIGWLHQILPVRTQGILWRQREKEHKIQRVWGTLENQDPLNQLIKEHVSS